ncbi:MAG: hypothetical protein QNJ32_19470 [Xenococcaceae cyanobacterium MO_167.B27]|nr:hypothetical protein [Xenococcaceae cyanobacterium MO_167.B27]
MDRRIFFAWIGLGLLATASPIAIAAYYLNYYGLLICNGFLVHRESENIQFLLQPPIGSANS